eukprot:CAMPEP_0172532750 /NCGR_PEP_ID=MMETSP1067-20121228/5686_1 /TAXON_ID=265564 ORGANISM="Thalassiosira punctigera, Strain Tpunct2005C2" /NCGR_SAMPLE_ID=MMETSP1067 /ASSEMBLY_ACC=CAM_ASM_000444 /LENGTH=384 /DNA_ID=CAMNT_0013317301 /DNA_START=267 /DNA_END=1418 /DNA_ORIENTATION=-
MNAALPTLPPTVPPDLAGRLDRIVSPPGCCSPSNGTAESGEGAVAEGGGSSPVPCSWLSAGDWPALPPAGGAAGASVTGAAVAFAGDGVGFEVGAGTASGVAREGVVGGDVAGTAGSTFGSKRPEPSPDWTGPEAVVGGVPSAGPTTTSKGAPVGSVVVGSVVTTADPAGSSTGPPPPASPPPAETAGPSWPALADLNALAEEDAFVALASFPALAAWNGPCSAAPFEDLCDLGMTLYTLVDGPPSPVFADLADLPMTLNALELFVTTAPSEAAASSAETAFSAFELATVAASAAETFSAFASIVVASFSAFALFPALTPFAALFPFPDRSRRCRRSAGRRAAADLAGGTNSPDSAATATRRPSPIAAGSNAAALVPSSRAARA